MNYSVLLRELPKNISALLRKEPGWIIPNILLTYACTQNCLQCSIPSKANPSQVMTSERLNILVQKLVDHGTQGISISGGDPLAHPKLVELLNQIADKNFAFLHLLTNLFAPEKAINDLIPSLLRNRVHLTTSFDGFGAVADKIRGADRVSDKVSAVMEQITRENSKLRVNKRIHTRATVVISQQNLHQVKEIIRFLEHLNWEISVDIYRCSSIQHQDADELHIKDLTLLEKVLEQCVVSKSVITPDAVIKGYIPFLRGNFPKKCPYLSKPTLGSKFFIQPDGEVLVCKGGSIGNLLDKSPRDLVNSPSWDSKMADFNACKGCWNPCYTPFAMNATFFEMTKRLRRITKSRNEKPTS